MDDFLDLCESDIADNTDSEFVKLPLIGEIAPEFVANTTNGAIKFPDDFIGSWVILFSHPSDFTPVCTSEFIAFQKEIQEFEKLNAKLLGLSVGAISSHLAWIDAISKLPDGTDIQFPVIDDANMRVAKKYGMIHPAASDTSAVRAVFVIDPTGIIRAILYYPAVLGRNISEIRRMLIGLQVADKFKVATPANWNPGDLVLSPAPQTVSALRQHTGKEAWFYSHKGLSENDIFSKIGKQKSGKK